MANPTHIALVRNKQSTDSHRKCATPLRYVDMDMYFHAVPLWFIETNVRMLVGKNSSGLLFKYLKVPTLISIFTKKYFTFYNTS